MVAIVVSVVVEDLDLPTWSRFGGAIFFVPFLSLQPEMHEYQKGREADQFGKEILGVVRWPEPRQKNAIHGAECVDPVMRELTFDRGRNRGESIGISAARARRKEERPSRPAQLGHERQPDQLRLWFVHQNR
jgi:hypothetical protein